MFEEKAKNIEDQRDLILPEEMCVLMKDFLDAKVAEKLAKDQIKTIAAKIQAKMKEKEVAMCGQYNVKWTKIVSYRFDTKSFEKDRPKEYEAYVKPSLSRRFSVQMEDE